MAKYRDGEYMALVFDWADHPEFVKGHVDLERAQAAMNAHHGDDKRILEITHQYGFWGVGQDEMGEPCQMFYARSEPGRGRFKVTKCEWEWTGPLYPTQPKEVRNDA